MSSGKRRVAVVLHMLKDQPWGVQLKEDLEAGMAEAADVSLEFADSHGSQSEQLQHLDRFLDAQVDALVLVAIDPDGVRTALRRYRAADIPAIVIDNDLGDPELYRALILPDNLLFGRKMGEFFVEASEGKAEVVEICGIPKSTAATLRSQGFREAIAGSPGVRIIESCVGNWRYDRARETFARVLDKIPRFDGVFAQNDEMARAAWEAAHAVGRETEMLITGTDAIRGHGLQLVMKGELAATLINPSPGRAAASALLAVLRGEPCLERTLLHTSLIRSNERIRAWQESRKRR
jgi:ABC-type sugar transport system substrate-binding protein